jgi:dephospho-CoA kinase
MKIYEVFSDVAEGVHDPAIFKVVFLVGGPGSGKSYVSNKLGLRAMGLVTINSDNALEYLMGKHNLDLKMPPEEREKRDIVRARAKEITSTKRNLAIDGRLGLVIDGTGEDFDKINTLNDKLKSIGYDSFIIIVNTNLEIAQTRNRQRDRSVDDEIVIKKWTGVQRNIGKFLGSFQNSAVIDNNGEGKETEPQIQQTYKRLSNWVRQPSQSPAAKQWMASQSTQNS